MDTLFGNGEPIPADVPAALLFGRWGLSESLVSAFLMVFWKW